MRLNSVILNYGCLFYSMFLLTIFLHFVSIKCDFSSWMLTFVISLLTQTWRTVLFNIFFTFFYFFLRTGWIFSPKSQIQGTSILLCFSVNSIKRMKIKINTFWGDFRLNFQNFRCAGSRTSGCRLVAFCLEGGDDWGLKGAVSSCTPTAAPTRHAWLWRSFLLLLDYWRSRLHNEILQTEWTQTLCDRLLWRKRRNSSLSRRVSRTFFRFSFIPGSN